MGTHVKNAGPQYCYDNVLKSMTRCNKLEIYYLFNYISMTLLFIFVPHIILYEYSSLHFLYCAWLECIRSYMESPSHDFLASCWFVHSRFMKFSNLFKAIVHYLLIRKMISLIEMRFPWWVHYVYGYILNRNYNESWHKTIE